MNWREGLKWLVSSIIVLVPTVLIIMLFIKYPTEAVGMLIIIVGGFTGGLLVFMTIRAVRRLLFGLE